MAAASNIVYTLLDARVIAGEAETLICADTDIATCVELSAAYGGALRQMGVDIGQRVQLAPPRDLASLVAVLGTLRIGAIAVLNGPSEFDTADLDYRVVLEAGRIDPAAAPRLQANSPACASQDQMLTTAMLWQTLIKDEPAEAQLERLIWPLRCLARGEVIQFEAG